MKLKGSRRKRSLNACRWDINTSSGRHCDYDALKRIWRSRHGDEAATWLDELNLCGALEPSIWDSKTCCLTPGFQNVAHSILLDPQSRHYGSRVWVQGGVGFGWQQDRDVLVANFYDWQRKSLVLPGEQSSMPNIDFSQARILIWGRQQLPQQLLAGQLQHLLHLQLRNNGVAELPANIWQLSVLQELCISGCHWLQTLPESLHQLKALQRLTCSDCQALVTLPESVENMTALQQLDLTCCAQLTQLPLSVGELTQLRVLDLSNCCSLAALPESIGQLLHLEQLRLDSCVSLTELPESIGKLAALNELNLSGCCMLKALPEPSQQLQALRTLHVDGCTSLVQPLPDRSWSPQRQIKDVLRLQRSQPAVIKLATQQETMLTTLERMSWLAVLLATATFIAFMQPPGGLENEQVLVSDSSACSWHAVHAADGTSDDAADRQCVMLVFFIMDGLSFGFSMGCVMLIIVLSMPRLQYEDQNIEAGRFWLLLLATWVLLYLAVLTGFAAFIASGLAVMNTWRVVVGPVIPGMALLVVGVLAIVTRFHSLHPGAVAVKYALLTLLSPWSSRVNAKDEDADIEMGQTLFWKHCKKALEPKQQQQQQGGGAAAGHSAADETQRLLAPLDPGASSSGGP